MLINLKERLKILLEGLPSKVKIGKTYIGEGEPVFVVAEIGINHNGDVEIAKKLIDAAVEAGANAVKFQKRTVEEILTKEGLNKPYNSPHAFAPTYGEHRQKLEFSEKQYQELKDYADKKDTLFFASVWDFKSADFMEKLGVAAYKIPSADLINLPLLQHIAKKNKPILISTGMSTFDEIRQAVSVILKYNKRLILFDCLSLYPAPEEKINLRFMDVLKKEFAPLPVGYSGHELDYLPTLVAVARGADIIERHLTLSKKMKGSDHAASLEPHEFRELVQLIRRVEKILGVPEKIFHKELIPIREKLAKSVATKVFIPKNTIISAEMLTIKGPGHGIKPAEIENLVGRVAQIDLEEDTIIPKEALSWPRK